ncbi:MAG: hypothetical protein A2096_03915 [Spirochaetes bacterium GWF1_41_5]|nr:MAG: hypothetical protein A2096_03915 [Spirochaetes bacterium GWF1_41_5]HBE01146.1 hypothetical protein [Spirochaetia bacterium]
MPLIIFCCLLLSVILFPQTVPDFKFKRLSAIPTGGNFIKGKMAIIYKNEKSGRRKILCFGAGRELCVYDITRAAEPVMLLKKDFTGDTVNSQNDLFEIISSGKFLILAGSFRSGGDPKGKPPFQMGFIQTIDISSADPTEWDVPAGGNRGRWASFYEDAHSWTCSDVELEGEAGKPGCFLHISGNVRDAGHVGGCLIIDISDPANPKKRGDIKWNIDGPYMGHGVTFDGHYQYHGNYFMGVYLVDYKNPDHLKVAGAAKFKNARDAARSVIKIDKYLYATVAVGNRNFYSECSAGIASFDVSSPDAPVLAGQSIVPQKDRPTADEYAHDTPPHKIYSLLEKYLIINLGAKGIGIFDRQAKPEAPVYLGLLTFDIVPAGTRPLVWDNEIWIIGDGPNFIKDGIGNKENYVHIYSWEKS